MHKKNLGKVKRPAKEVEHAGRRPMSSRAPPPPGETTGRASMTREAKEAGGRSRRAHQPHAMQAMSAHVNGPRASRLSAGQGALERTVAMMRERTESW